MKDAELNSLMIEFYKNVYSSWWSELEIKTRIKEFLTQKSKEASDRNYMKLRDALGRHLGQN